ncbi:two-component system, chemotaxis family, response regulator CheB [Bryocella elongata]|uniref:Protein-glutamate methylesterase/protein-glutamine glutaminase n=1 Tax=Bryocella elongata TaxID=863522 RepID=A0A1H5TIG5_9BACT|nr:chemotaxis response regulator protein-glutamate methylesterase [Bryocella elongata]SEF61891.1 two-component system, chemotaxis family, response regulator CheB [Bryocella elongata]
MDQRGPIRVLIVDDSALVRKLLTAALADESQIEVVGTAADPYVARDKILQLNPDVITLDIEMPRMNGLAFLKKLMQFRPMPVVMITSLAATNSNTTLEALRAGAVEILAKPDGPNSVGDLKLILGNKIRSAAAAHIRTRRDDTRPAMAGLMPVRSTPPTNQLPVTSCAPGMVLAIGASTGGPPALTELLGSLPADIPPIVIVQHMPPVFTKHFAERLNHECAFPVKEAADGDELLPGRALIAPGDFHMIVEAGARIPRVRVMQGPPVCFSRPSVDVLFTSVASVLKKNAVGILLTGMGSDGARGMLAMRQSGAATIAQDEASSVVYGMPKEAARIGAAESVLALNKIGPFALEKLKQMAKSR